ncbi:MAG: hypothetical protein PHI11_07480 [Gallionella sp.]|nr:hypothetical protein [Gallionella sp.]
MKMTRTRYPGAQSFSDDALSRAVFFGRENETRELTDQIIANRLVVVYAKSGLGKTSLLNAGVAEPLREDHFLPLVTRVNLVNQNLLHSLFDMIRTSAERQNVEYRHGDEQSLWHFFKTAEFWHGDILLTPVLILDQFEELFTLHNDEIRGNFLAELGYLIRGIRPPKKECEDSSSSSLESDSSVTDTPPIMRIVISLREDYLGFLEEATDYLPQILDHRFRLLPLSVNAAKAAIDGPATVQHQELATKPFIFQPEAVQGILKYLLSKTQSKVKSSYRFIEPFHLQLVCQHAEDLAVKCQSQASDEVEVSWEALGGEKGMKATLSNFYLKSIQSLQTRQMRRSVRELCEQSLISPTGRRLSLEENEIMRLFKLDHETLQQLVNNRLLRTDQRADNWYYELSHDCLIESILATRRIQGVFFGVIGLLWSFMMCIIGFILVVVIPISVVVVIVDSKESNAFDMIVALLILFIPVGINRYSAGRSGWRRSMEMLNRFFPPVSW